MTKEELEKQNAEGMGQTAPSAESATEVPTVDERPNRTAFSKRFSKRHSDIDFEDKEARYGAMNDDADMLSKYEESGKALSGIMDNNKWFAAVLMKMQQNPDMNPVEAMADFGVDIQAALQDPEEAKKVADIIAKHQEAVADQEKHADELVKNLRKSRKVAEELFGENASDMWERFFEIIGDAENGIVSKDTWQLFMNGNNYDSDISSAREEAAMQARNEKIQNKVRSSASENIPPSLSSSGAGNTPAKPKKQKGGIDFFEGITH